MFPFQYHFLIVCFGQFSDCKKRKAHSLHSWRRTNSNHEPIRCPSGRHKLSVVGIGVIASITQFVSYSPGNSGTVQPADYDPINLKENDDYFKTSQSSAETLKRLANT